MAPYVSILIRHGSMHAAFCDFLTSQTTYSAKMLYI